jgi:hypothetical protein
MKEIFLVFYFSEWRNRELTSSTSPGKRERSGVRVIIADQLGFAS